MSIKYRVPVLIAVLFAATAGLTASEWDDLEDDGLHDPSNPAVDILQEPADALGVLPPDTAGNKVDWAEALRGGHITPRASLDDERRNEVLELDILMRNTLPARYVMFSHTIHTQWMACETCHEGVFLSETDANPVNMGKILNGEYCGVCHGAVAFPLTECDRCHNTDSSTVSDVETTNGVAE